MKFFLYVIVNTLFDILCFIVNPIVVLFADDKGVLPEWLKMFGTHDGALDQSPQWDKEKWPLIVDRPDKPQWFRDLLRYLRRVTWLYRNTGYGFAYYVMGYEMDPNKIVSKGNINLTNLEPASPGWFFAYDKTESILTRGWCLSIVLPYGSLPICFNVYLGWKFIPLLRDKRGGRTMMAMRISPFLRYAQPKKE